MLRYTLAKLGTATVVLFAVTVVVSLMVHVVPGDPALTVLGPRATPELIKQIRAEMGFDLPLGQQLLQFWVGLLQGDLGRDFLSNRPVTEIIQGALPHTVILAISSIATAVIAGIPLGVVASRRPGSLTDRLIATLSISLVTVPTYVTSLLLVLLFAVHLGWLPAVGAGDFSNPLDYLRRLILPTTVLALTWVGYLARLVRSSMIEALASDYVRTATALGVGPRRVVYRHALRNALIPSITILGVGLGLFLGGAVFVETILNRPGLGSLMVGALTARNYPVLRGTVLVVALLFVLSNLAADLISRGLDPRTRIARDA